MLISLRFDLSVVVAPAMVYKTNTLVCGHSIEVNCVSDVDTSISLSQIKLASSLFTEFLHIFDPFILDEEVIKRPKIMFPYPRFDTAQLELEEEEIQSADFTVKDSGIDTLDIQSILSLRTARTKVNHADNFWN